MKMRPSRVLKKLRAGEVVSSFKTNLSDARAVEIAAMSGFDCIWTDLEHTANDWSAVEQQIWAAKAYDADVLVRVARGSYSDYVRALELDAAGIMVPHIMSLEDAKNVVRMTRFHPIGRRPVDSGNADGAYCNIDFLEYIKQANEQRFVIVQIEDPEPLDDLEAIASLDGIDMLFFGPADFSHGIGAPAQWDHPKLVETRRRVAEVCTTHGKFAGTPGTPDTLDELIGMGYRFINMGADVVGLSQYCSSMAEQFAKRKIATDQ
ncbi:MAG: aldolase [Candidatus Latescibacteria bacterium]|nr:aldolase [Candidatus Latescibacterota bacterium]MCK5733023.1 aldolase [Candidatus Latescibacterota bacterium]